MPDYVNPEPNAAFPRRPDHPHFRLLAQLAQDLDGDSGALPRQGPESWLNSEDIDVDSAFYLARNRGIRLVAGMGPIPKELQYMLAATWLDGFALGYLFALNRTDR